MKLLGFIFHSCKEFELSTIRLLFCALVRSILEYASVVWNPFYACHCFVVESVQNRILRYFAFRIGLQFGDYSYLSIRNRFNLKSLANRRRQLDVIFLHSILCGTINCPSLKRLFLRKSCSYKIRYQENFLIPTSRTNYSYYKPINRLRRLGNEFSILVNLFILSSRSQLLNILKYE